jgi:predicted metal-dependent phosphoesterase TrpH
MSYHILHCHTHASDGTLTHEEVLTLAQKYNIGTIAFTDHDTLIDPELFAKWKAAQHPVDVISGIEVSANYIAEVPGEISLFHIIGLFVDPTNADLRAYCVNAKAKRLERATRVVESLNKEGFTLSVPEVLAQSDDGNVGRPHIVRALMTHPENLARVDTLMEEWKATVRTDPSTRSRYELAVLKDTWGRIFDLVLVDQAFIPGVYVPYLHRLSMDEAVELIRNAGGIAILAHWSYIKHKLTPALLEQIAREGRIDGIETVYALSDPRSDEDTEFATSFDADRALVRSLIAKYNLIPGGGGDFHTPEDFARLCDPANKALAEETIDFIDRITQKFPNHSLAWSTLKKN